MGLRRDWYPPAEDRSLGGIANNRPDILSRGQQRASNDTADLAGDPSNGKQ
jgi:hypothetical protein